MRISHVLRISALTVLAGACGGDSHTGAPRTLPAVSNLAIAGNANNVLSAIARQTVANADSARVVYWTGSGAKVGTPFTTDLSSGRILVLGLRLFDNGTRHPTAESRAVEYQLDTTAHTATFVWQYQHRPPFFTAFTGSVRRLVNGNTVIGWTLGVPVVATEVTSIRDHGVGGHPPCGGDPGSVPLHEDPVALRICATLI